MIDLSMNTNIKMYLWFLSYSNSWIDNVLVYNIINKQDNIRIAYKIAYYPQKGLEVLIKTVWHHIL